MILSHSKSFLFIKTRKTAGTSIEIALSALCTAGDVITPISPEDELIRKQWNGLPARNFSRSPKGEERYREAIDIGELKEIESARKIAIKDQVYWNHMPAHLIKETLADNTWRDLFKFTIDRHPYEKAVSQAYFQYARQPDTKPDFDVFLDRVIERGTFRNIDLYSDGNDLLVDLVLRYENLPDCLSNLRTRPGLAGFNAMPLTKHQFRKNRRPATDILSQRQKSHIFKHCEKEFELLGYDQ